MANGDLRSSCDRVLGNDDLLGEILIRVGSSMELLRCAAVSPHWRGVSRGAAFRLLFGDRHQAAHVGFLVEMQEGIGRIVKLMYADVSEPSSVAIRQSIVLAVLAADNVVGSSDGLIITVRDGQGYFTSYPANSPRNYKFVAPEIPGIPRATPEYTINTFGQFAFVPHAGRGGMYFFIKDPSRHFITCYDGVTFCSSTDVRFHVCVSDGRGWTRSVSPAYESPEPALFHRNPYSVLVGTSMYMMYIVGYIVRFDVVSKHFTMIELPSEVLLVARSWYDLTVARHDGGGIVRVHYHKGNLHSWVLSYVNGEVSWTHQLMVDLVAGFGNMISFAAWQQVLGREAFPLGSDHFFSVQVRKASRNGRFVLLTFGFDLRMYEVDMVATRFRLITSAVRTGMLGRMYSLSEPWPVNS